MRILLLEDDPYILELLLEGLSEDGYQCTPCSSADEALELAQLFPFSLLILDVMLPEGADAGFDLGHRLRQNGISTPILFLSARSSIDDRVRGLEVGGDDYLSKPFAYRELLARVRVLQRRSSGQAQNVLKLPYGWSMDLSSREVYSATTRAELSRREYLLLELFACTPGRAFERLEIIERLWAGEAGVDAKVIDVYVSTLRRKTAEGLIETVRGVGYRLGRD